MPERASCATPGELTTSEFGISRARPSVHDGAAFRQNLHDLIRHIWNFTADGLEPDVGRLGGFVGRVDPCEILDLLLRYLGVQALGVAARTFLDRRIDEHFDKLSVCDERAH